jgi:hypothetical protein
MDEILFYKQLGQLVSSRTVLPRRRNESGSLQTSDSIIKQRQVGIWKKNKNWQSSACVDLHTVLVQLGGHHGWTRAVFASEHGLQRRDNTR